MFALRDLWQGIGDFKIFIKYRDKLYAYFSICAVICKIYQQKKHLFQGAFGIYSSSTSSSTITESFGFFSSAASNTFIILSA